jgi:peptidoglycan/xylan/chitin deacetylase (PgdA/CDA1 family)
VLLHAPARAPEPPGSFQPLVGPLRGIVVHVSGPRELIAEAEHGLPAGAARPEAVAVRLRRSGVELAWGEPVDADDRRALIAHARERGRSSVELLRADPSLVTELEAGAWFNAAWRARLLRRLVARARAARLLARVPLGGLALRTAMDAAFWLGVRDVASQGEWRRLARSSYVVLCYHRLAGEMKPGQEAMDLPPRLFARQLHALRLLGFRPLEATEMARFHSDPSASLPARRYVITADDGFRDNLGPLSAAGGAQLFVPTSEVGGSAWWMDGEPTAAWGELARLEREGVAIGSHSRSHVPLTELGEGEAREALRASRRELAERLERPLAMLAYPHGSHDAGVREAAIAAGFDGAYTTHTGRNGAGTDRYCLRRVEPKAHDGLAGFAWKVLTGELLPRRWEERVNPALGVRRSSPAAEPRGDDPQAQAPPPTPAP